MVTLYTLPSIAALALKLSIFWFGRHSFSSANIWLWLFFAGLFGMNLSELATFYYVTTPEAGFLWLKLYYLSAQISCYSLLALAINNTHKLKRSTISFGATFFIITAICLFIPDTAIIGIKSIGYSLTRIAGPYYFLIQLGILVPLSSSLLLCIHTSFYGQSYEIRRKSQILAIACSPSFVTATIVMILMHQGYQINASAILSLSITFTLMVLVYTEHKEHRYKFMSLIPTTKEHSFVKDLANLITDPTLGLERGRVLVEQEMIREALTLAQGNKIRAAEILGVSRQTLQRKLGRSKKDNTF